jgi:hypothetical protein
LFAHLFGGVVTNHYLIFIDTEAIEISDELMNFLTSQFTFMSTARFQPRSRMEPSNEIDYVIDNDDYHYGSPDNDISDKADDAVEASEDVPDDGEYEEEFTLSNLDDCLALVDDDEDDPYRISDTQRDVIMNGLKHLDICAIEEDCVVLKLAHIADLDSAQTMLIPTLNSMDRQRQLRLTESEQSLDILLNNTDYGNILQVHKDFCAHMASKWAVATDDPSKKALANELLASTKETHRQLGICIDQLAGSVDGAEVERIHKIHNRRLSLAQFNCSQAIRKPHDPYRDLFDPYIRVDHLISDEFVANDGYHIRKHMASCFCEDCSKATHSNMLLSLFSFGEH